MKTINDVKSMSLYSLSNKVPTFYFVCLINSNFISLYVDTFINNTQTFQVNDARQLPIIVPEKSVLDKFESIFNNTIQMKKNLSSFKIDLEKMQLEIDNLVNELYNI